MTSTTNHLARRHRAGKLWRWLFWSSTLFGLLMLVILIGSIIDSAFGYTVISQTVDPATLTDGRPLETLTAEQLSSILQHNLRPARLKVLEREQALQTRSPEELRQLLENEIVKPKIENVWGLYQSLTQGDRIMQRAAQEWPQARVSFRAWLTPGMIGASQSSNALLAGVRTAVLGSMLVILITVALAFPIGIGAAIYLEEYAERSTINSIIQTNINNLAGVPSIIYGMLGLAIFVRVFSQFTSGALAGYPNADPNNGRTVLSAGLTMALLILPVIIINTQEAIRAVPGSLRQASYGLGATRWQTVWNHVLPNAIPGILTGTILAISRAFGETAPLVIVGAATYITFDPDSVFSRFTTLPIQIYQWTARPQAEFRSLAAAAILILLALLLSLNALAIFLRNHYSRKTL